MTLKIPCYFLNFVIKQDMNKVTTKAIKDAAVLLLTRVKVCLTVTRKNTGQEEFSGFKGHFSGGEKKYLQL